MPVRIVLNNDVVAQDSPELDWSDVHDFAYQLQDIDLEAIGDTKYDLIIMDYSSDGSDDAKFTSEQISALKNSPGGDKLVLSYMSIGEAEDYRWYWEECCDANGNGIPDSDAPSWLGPENPDWEGNYKVRYWDPDWQAIIFSYVDRIMDAGFDGVYLDIIDAYEYWGPEGDSGLDRETAEQDMVVFVLAIAEYARVTKGDADFGVFPQNGEALSSHADYVEAVTGIGREDVWYDDNSKQPKSEVKQVTADLDVFKEAGKLVLVIDYPTKQKQKEDFYKQALAKGYIPYAADRDLDTLKIFYFGPDIKVSTLTVPSKVKKDAMIKFTTKITNAGIASLTTDDVFTLAAYLSTDNTLSDDDIVLAEQEISKQIKSRGSATIKSSALVPSDITFGNYYLLVHADSNDDVTESDEDNNIRSSKKLKIQ